MKKEMIKGIGNISAVAGGILILSGLLTSGCKRKSEVIGEKKMIEVITDLKLAEAYANNQAGGPMNADTRKEFAASVLASHNVTQEQFDSTLSWYGRNLDKYSELYEKVDKRISSKRKELMKDSEGEVRKENSDNMWPYAENGVLSSLGTSDGWILSIPDPDLRNGDRLEWSFHLTDITMPLTGVLGVEYSDGTSEAVSTHLSSRQHVELSLQTDTAKTVTRIYGTMRRTDQDSRPLFVDSIRLYKLAFDSVEFSKFRTQKKYGYPIRMTPEDRKRKAVADSLRRDSIRQSVLSYGKTKAGDTDKEVKLDNQEVIKPTDEKPVKPTRPGGSIRR